MKIMKKYLASISALIIVATMLTACGISGTTELENSVTTADISGETSEAASELSQEQTETSEAPEKDSGKNTNSKSLVILFDYSQNIDTTGLDIDAISSASLRGGSTGRNIENLKVMADTVTEMKGAEIFPIQVNETYPPDFEDMTGIAKDDIADNKQFTFKTEPPDLDDYDTIYFGVPVWWGELPQPVHVFFQKYDFSGKTIVPFGIHHGSRFGRMVIQMRDYEPDATVLDGFTIDADTDNEDVKSEFSSYLGTLQ